MNLTELQRNKKTLAQRALRENYELDVNLGNLGAKQTLTMLTKVRGLLKESRGAQQQIQNNRGYLKLVMMEQMLSEHYKDLRVARRLVVENEEVQKSQVILAAQDMIYNIQKMIEQVSKMNAEELPAVVTGVQYEIGTSEGEQFQQAAGESLTQLQQALTQAKSSLSGALGQITGTGGGEALGGEMGGEEMGGEEEEFGAEELPGGGEEEFGAEEEFGDDDEEGLPELPEPEEDLGGAGRERR
jgi:hypothetical protein